MCEPERERDRLLYTGKVREREREEEEKGEKGLCFPGNKLGVSPTPIGSLLVGIGLLPTKLEASTVSVFWLISVTVAHGFGSK